jgi:hypothetical protein
MTTVDERNVDPVMEMRRTARARMKVDSWGFKESYHSTKTGNLVFDSELCRISLIWGGWDQGGGNSMHIRYGRLHAPNEKTTSEPTEA